MKFLKFKKKAVAAALVSVMAFGLSTLALIPKVNASTPGTYTGVVNCEPNSVIWCGTRTVADIQNAYNNGDGHNSAQSIQVIYNYFNIHASDVSSLNSTAVMGAVTKSGEVIVDGHVVATNAITGGRQDDPNHRSTYHNISGVTFYTRPPSVSFLDNELSAFVVMHNGQFAFAILAPCGNAVMATPTQPTPATLACKLLLNTVGNADAKGDVTYTFEGQASATSNATISSYAFNFGAGHGTQTINTSATSATSGQQTYAPGTYTVTLTVSGIANNVYSSAPANASCTQTFTVKAPPVALVCDNLKLNEGTVDTKTGNIPYTLTAKATPTNATITKYVFDFGKDQSGGIVATPQTITSSANSATSQSVTYLAGKSYSKIFVTIYATAVTGQNLTAGGVSSSCSTNLTVPPQTCATGSTAQECQPTCTSPTNGQQYPVGSAECQPAQTPMCTVPGKTNLPANSPECVTPPTPPVMPNTGAGNIFGLFAGTSAIGGLFHRFVLKRRSL